MEYKIKLSQMEFRSMHGCYELERKVGNRFAVDLEITTELGELHQSDRVEDAVNYLTVYERVRHEMGIVNHTIEAVAYRIIQAVRELYPQVISVECSVAKIAPPLGGKIDRVSVTLRG